MLFFLDKHFLLENVGSTTWHTSLNNPDILTIMMLLVGLQLDMALIYFWDDVWRGANREMYSYLVWRILWVKISEHKVWNNFIVHFFDYKQPFKDLRIIKFKNNFCLHDSLKRDQAPWPRKVPLKTRHDIFFLFPSQGTHTSSPNKPYNSDAIDRITLTVLGCWHQKYSSKCVKILNDNHYCIGPNGAKYRSVECTFQIVTRPNFLRNHLISLAFWLWIPPLMLVTLTHHCFHLLLHSVPLNQLTLDNLPLDLFLLQSIYFLL